MNRDVSLPPRQGSAEASDQRGFLIREIMPLTDVALQVEEHGIVVAVDNQLPGAAPYRALPTRPPEQGASRQLTAMQQDGCQGSAIEPTEVGISRHVAAGQLKAGGH